MKLKPDEIKQLVIVLEAMRAIYELHVKTERGSLRDVYMRKLCETEELLQKLRAE